VEDVAEHDSKFEGEGNRVEESGVDLFLAGDAICVSDELCD